MPPRISRARRIKKVISKSKRHPATLSDDMEGRHVWSSISSLMHPDFCIEQWSRFWKSHFERIVGSEFSSIARRLPLAMGDEKDLDGLLWALRKLKAPREPCLN